MKLRHKILLRPHVKIFVCVYINFKSIAIIHWHILHFAAILAGKSYDSADSDNIL